MRQQWSGILVVIVGIAATVFNRFAAEESLKWWAPWLMPSLGEARIFVVIWGVVVVFLGVAVMLHPS
ncbi:MAG: hypothetical protein ACREA9_27660 [Pyrinomonadaceae bacterium]